MVELKKLGTSLNHKISTQKSYKWQSNLKEVLRLIGLVGFYYTFSIGLTFYNKWMFKFFKFPLISTCIHFITVYLFSGFFRFLFSKCRKTTITLGWSVYLKKVFVTGVVSSLDIGLSNWSFLFITVSLYTMVKSTCIIFILGFAILFKLEKARCSLIFVVLFVSGGLFMFVFESTQFNMEGFILVLSASFLGGIRWTLSQILTQKKELGLSNPIDLLYHLQPTMFVGLFPLALAHEGLGFFTTRQMFGYNDIEDMLPSVYMILIGGFIAFMLSFSEYLLLTNTSSITVSVCGIFKEIATLLLATAKNGDRLSFLNWIGFVVCMIGIMLHVTLKFFNKDDEKAQHVSESIQMNLLGDNWSESDSENELFNIKHNRIR